MSKVIGGFAPRSTATDAANGYQLEGAFGVHALSVGSLTFVYVSGLKDNGISAFALGFDGSLTNIQNFSDNATLKLAGATAINSATVGGATYLYVAASLNHKPGYINVFRVGSDGKLTFVETFADTAQTQLSGIEGKMAVATVGASTFLVATGDDDNGVSVFRINADGRLTNTHNLHDNATLRIDNAMDAVTAQVGTKTFVFVAGEDDNGLSAFELKADGTLTNTDNLADDATLNLWGAMGLATAAVGGTTYLIASGGYDDGLSVFAVSSAGQFTNVFNISDTAARGLNGAQGLTTFMLGGETFLAVSGRDDDALSVFQLGAGGKLTDVSVLFDNAGVALGGSHYNTVATVGGTSFLIATGFNDNGVSVFEILVNKAPSEVVFRNTVAATVENGAPVRMADIDVVDDGLGTNTLSLMGADRNRFEIRDGANGKELWFKGDADFESQAAYNVAVTASDSSVVGSQPVSRTFALNIINVNEASTISGPATARIVEGSASGTLVARISAADPDGDPISYSFLSGNENGAFRIVGSEILVADPSKLDFETSWLNDYTLVIEGSDGTLDSTNTVSIAVTITNVNDEAPSAVSLDGGAVREAASKGTVVGTLSATDLDSSSFTYTLLDDAAGRFALSGNQIVVADGLRLDFEQQARHTIQLRVSDGQGGLFVERINLAVTDISPELITGDARANTIEADRGRDVLNGGRGHDHLESGAGADKLVGGSGRDNLRGGADTDALLGGSGADNLWGGADRDKLVGGKGADELWGGKGKDLLKGGAGRDKLRGEGGNDKLVASEGADDLWGGKGCDLLNGQGGPDNFVFTSLRDSGRAQSTRDTIVGFGGKDDIDLSAIDAVRGQKGNQAFALDLDGLFDKGEIRQTEVKGGVLLEMNVDGDSHAEMSILLRGFHGSLSDEDFVF